MYYIIIFSCRVCWYARSVWCAEFGSEKETCVPQALEVLSTVVTDVHEESKPVYVGTQLYSLVCMVEVFLLF